jgi:hypothetical protein
VRSRDDAGRREGILTGGQTSAADFFRKKTEVTLTSASTPIVKATTDKVGLAAITTSMPAWRRSSSLIDEGQRRAVRRNRHSTGSIPLIGEKGGDSRQPVQAAAIC